MDDTENAPPPGADDTPLLHRLVFFGKVLPGFEEATVREALARHLKRAPAELFTGRQVAVSEPLDPAEAEVARQALQALGARVQVETVEAPPPMAPLSFLELAAPPPPQDETAPQGDLALTDSGWQALSQALVPSPDAPPEEGGLPALPSLKLEASAAPPMAPAHGEENSHLFPPGSFPSALSSLPPLPAAPAPLAEKAAAPGWQAKPQAASRPPTDLSSVFGSATPPPPIGETSPVFAPLAKAPLPPPAAAAALPSASPARDTLPVSGLTMADALPAPVPGIPESALLVNCPNCGERQPMRVLCRACGSDLQRALAVRQEERDQARAARGAKGGAAAGGQGAPVDDGMRILGVRVPDDLAQRFTLANGLLALFGLLLVLAAVGFIWRMVRPEPVLSSPRAAVAAPDASAPGDGGQAASANAPRMGPPPPEEEVASRLRIPAPIGEFRQAYWPKATNKVFAASGDGNAWAWRAGMPSVTRAVAEALNECESRRSPEAPECKVVNINNFWQE